MKQEEQAKVYKELIGVMKALFGLKFGRTLTDAEVKNLIENLHYYLEGIK